MAEQNRRRAAGIVVAVAAVAVAGVIALVAHLGGSSSTAAGSGPTANVSVATTEGGIVRSGDVPPHFAATATDGSRIDLAALRGRVVLVSFFASWCTNCREDLPRIQAAAAADGARGLVVIPVSYRETGDARAYLRSIGITIPAIVDPNDSIGEAYGVEDLPVTVWVGRDGRVADVVVGQLTQQALDAELASLLPAS